MVFGRGVSEIKKETVLLLKPTGHKNPVTVFDYINWAFMILIVVLILYPCLYVVKQSFVGSAGSSVSLSLIPQDPSLLSYRKVFMSEYIGYGFINTLRRLVIGTPLTLIVTILAAYPLSKHSLPNRALWTGIFVFTMFFSGGMIPDYLIVKQVGIYDTPWALVLPRLIDVFNLLIMRNYMMSLPDSLEESAKIDGASDMRVLLFIILPLSMPILATIGLWTMVNHWSWWFDSLLYIKDAKGMVLQVVMRRIVLEGTMQMMDQSGFQDETLVNAEGLKAAVIMVTTIPIVCVYPFLQKYFVKGILVGSLKG